MTINRVAAQQIIKKVPTKLRDAARAERKVIINESKKDPIGTSIRAAHGQFDFVNNEKLQKMLSDLNKKLSADKFVSPRQPITRTSTPEVEVVKASSILG